MNRRRLIQSTFAAAATAGFVGPEAFAADPDVIQRVSRALLSMQRASWEQGVAAQAFLERGETDLVYLMAKEAELRQTAEGRLSVLYTDNGVTDPAASGEAVLHAARRSGDEGLRQAAERMLRYLLEKAPRAADGTLYHTLNEPEIWVDSMYMAPPFLAAAGHHEEAVRQLDGMDKVLWNPQKKLYSHRWHDGRKEFVNAKPWGVGNGWALAGLARVIDALPDGMPAERQRLAGRAQETLDSCLGHMRSDYLFHNVLDEPDSFVETNMSQMVAYTLYRGVQSGWLDRGYLSAADGLRRAAHGKVDEHGYVQGVCGAPFFEAPGRASEGQAFFLLMEAARGRLQGSNSQR